MRKIVLVLLLLLLLGSTQALTWAQEPLTETFTAANGSFSFKYPAGWKWIESQPPSPPGAKLVVGSFSATLEIRPNAAGETAEAYTKERLQRAGRSVPVTVKRVGGRDVATAALSGTNKILIVADPARVAIMVLLGDVASVPATDETFLEILGSYQYGAAVRSTAAPTAIVLTAVPTATIAPTATVTPTPEATRPVVVDGASTLAFGAFNGDYSDLFLTNPGGKTLAQFTQQQVSALLPVWSPDGMMLAYLTDTSPTLDFVYDVFVAPVNGGAPVKVSSQSSTDRGAIAWSPDSKQLIFAAFRDGGNGAQIYKVNVDGTGEQKLAIDAQGINGFTLDWSPDGQHIALMGFPNEGSDYAILLAQPDGSNLTPVPNIPVVQSGEYFKWSNNGQKAVISNATSLTVTQGDGSAPQVILGSSAGMTIGGVDWSPDGTQIAFSGYPSTDTTVGLYIIDADGSNLHQVDLGGRQLAWGGVAWGSVVGGPEQLAVTEAPPPPTLDVVIPCSVTTPGTANLRTGPGTNYDSNGTFSRGTSLLVTGKAPGSDGKVWYRVESGDWVRSDVVVPGGSCANIRTVEP